MEKIHVIIVPEKDEYAEDLFYYDTVYINPALGKPRLKERNAKYLAPLLLSNEEHSVTRIFHILEFDKVKSIIIVGNSFVLDKPWNQIGQNRRFEYVPLEDFGFVEINNGILMNNKLKL